MPVTYKTPWFIVEDPYHRYRPVNLVIIGKYIDVVAIVVSDVKDGALLDVDGTPLTNPTATSHTLTPDPDGTSEKYIWNLGLDVTFDAKVRVDITGTDENTPEIQECYLWVKPEPKFSEHTQPEQRIQPRMIDFSNIPGIQRIDIPVDLGHSVGENSTFYDLKKGYGHFENMVPYDFSYMRQSFRAVYEPEKSQTVTAGMPVPDGLYIDFSGEVLTELYTGGDF